MNTGFSRLKFLILKKTSFIKQFILPLYFRLSTLSNWWKKKCLAEIHNMSTHIKLEEWNVKTNDDDDREKESAWWEYDWRGCLWGDVSIWEAIHRSQNTCKQKQVEKTYKSSKAVPDQKGVEEGGTKL